MTFSLQLTVADIRIVHTKFGETGMRERKDTLEVTHLFYSLSNGEN